MRFLQTLKKIFYLLIFITAAVFIFTTDLVSAQDGARKFPAPSQPLIAVISSPESTWSSFMALTDRYLELVREEGFTSSNASEMRALEKQIGMCFDLSTTPPSLCRSASVETAVCIREIVARFPESERAGGFPGFDAAWAAIKSGHPPVWRFHDLPIEIVLIQKGTYAENFQFSVRTIESVKTTLSLLRGKPCQDKSMEGMWDMYFLTPGPMIPDDWVRGLPSFATSEFFEQTVWQWALLLLSYPLVFAFIWGAVKFGRLVSRKLPRRFRQLHWLAFPLATIAVFYFQGSLMEDDVFITGDVLWAVKLLQTSAYLFSLLAIVLVVGNLLADLAVSDKRIQQNGFDAHLARFAIHLGSIAVAIAVLLNGLYGMGISLSTLLAGAGITGLAIALAAQETLRNIIGSVMLILDKPFKVGQFIKVRNHEGVVESMGLRSSKIRLSNGHLVSIANEDLARADIENIDARKYIFRQDALGIPADLPLAKLDQAVDIMKDILSLSPSGSPGLDNKVIHDASCDAPVACFDKFGKGSLRLVFCYWFRPADKWRYMAHCHQLNREIVRRFNEAGIKFSLEG